MIDEAQAYMKYIELQQNYESTRTTCEIMKVKKIQLALKH